MCMLLLVSTLGLLARFQDPDSPRPTMPVEAVSAAFGRTLDVEGSWMATVSQLPLPEGARRFHAPRHPWELARVSIDDMQRMVLASSHEVHGGWGAPDFAAVGPDGGLVAAWRLWNMVALISPAGTRSDVVLELPRGSQCVHVEHDGVIHAAPVGEDGKRRALTWRGFAGGGTGEPFDLGVMPQRAGGGLCFLREGDLVIWIRGADEIACFDVRERELRVLPCAGMELFDLDGVQGGLAFAHSLPMRLPEPGARGILRTIDLSSGRVLELPCAEAIAAFTPRGWLSTAHWHDFDTGQRVLLEQPVNTFKRYFWVGDSELRSGPRMGATRVVLRPWPRHVSSAGNRAPRLDIERLLTGGGDPGSMGAHLAELQRPYSAACVLVLARVAREWTDPSERRDALWFLGASCHPLASESLLPLLAAEPEWLDCMDVVHGLARSGDPGSARELVAALGMEKWEGGAADRFAVALAILGDREVLPELEALFERTQRPMVGAARTWLSERGAFLAALRACRSD